MKLIKTIKTVSNVIYIYKVNNSLFAFKPSKNIQKELLANKLAKLFDIETLNIKSAKIKNKEGILMPYLDHLKILSYYKRPLNNNQLNQLKRIVLFDIWTGNKDRHTANILINSNLIVFDHDKLFQKGKARNFIKLDIGRRLNKDYVDIIEKLLDKNLTMIQVLKKLGFINHDFVKVKEKDIRSIVKSKTLLKFLISRSNFNSIRF